MSSSVGHYPWWGFWRIAPLVVTVHAVLVLLPVISSFAFSYHALNDIQWNILSPMDAVAIALGYSESLSFVIPISTTLAVVGFYMARGTRKPNRVLVAYAAFQSAIGVLAGCAIFYLMLRGYIVVQRSTNGISQTGMIWDTADFANWFIAYFIVSLPLLLLLARLVYVILNTAKPEVDSSGRYMICTNCRYDLRGGCSATCPECGASVMVDDTENASSSTAAD